MDNLDEQWPEGVTTALSARTYIRNVVEKLEQLLEGEFPVYKKPMDENYHPETDTTPLVSSKSASIYRGMIGSCNWLVTLGQFDIHFAIQSLSRYSMAPREGHFLAVKQLMGYPKKFPKGKVVIDPNYMDWSKYDLTPTKGWTNLYPDAEEELPSNAPPTRGRHVRITCYVDRLLSRNTSFLKST